MTRFMYHLKTRYEDVRLKLVNYYGDPRLELIEFDSLCLSRAIFTRLKNTIMKKIEVMLAVDMLNLNPVDKTKDILSPYTFIVFAIQSKVQIYKFAEVI